jgi:hypothetical protein
MDVHLLRAERRRIAEQFRSTLTCLGILRGQLIGALTDEARQHLRSAMERESAVARELGEKLLNLDSSICKPGRPLSGEVHCFQRRSTFDAALTFSLT